MTATSPPDARTAATLDAEMIATSTRGSRTIPAAEFFAGIMTAWKLDGVKFTFAQSIVTTRANRTLLPVMLAANTPPHRASLPVVAEEGDRGRGLHECFADRAHDLCGGVLEAVEDAHESGADVFVAPLAAGGAVAAEQEQVVAFVEGESQAAGDGCGHLL